MAEPATETKISLKIIIDIKAKKVVFAEAGKEFVDFIFCIMSLPLSTVTKLLIEKAGMVGCLGSLYKSIESLDAQYYEPEFSKDSVLTPSLGVVVPLLSLNYNEPTLIRFYRCHCHTSVISRSLGATCPDCKALGYTTHISHMTEVYYRHIPSRPPGYVKGAVSYMVMDDLEVKPMSISLIRSLVKDFDYMEEKEVEFGLQEGLALLKASLEKQAVLTTVFLGNKI